MKMKMLSRATLALALALSFAGLSSCGDAGGESAALSLELVGNGLILPTANETCVDKTEGSGSRSATANSMLFQAIRLQWAPKSGDAYVDKDLFIGLVRVTVTSNALSNGSVSVVLSADEIEALFGADGGNLPGSSTGPVLRTSNLADGRTGYAASCAFTVGGLTYANANDGTTRAGQQYQANVVVELIGQSTDSDSKVEFVRKTYSTSATGYY